MSGTSADGIDAALVDISKSQNIALVEYHFSPFENELQQKITSLYEPGNNEIERMGALDTLLGHRFAEAATSLLDKANTKRESISAIGSHGQTIRHRPRKDIPFTLQIGDPNIIAANTGITTVADFRRRDVALGGQGAPLTPAFHQQAFAEEGINRGVLNLGGIANLTVLYGKKMHVGYDLGPSNGLMDYWSQKNRGSRFDKNGEWAQQGQVHEQLLETLLKHPFLQLEAPRSTGREEFSSAWLEDQLAHFADLGKQDVQRTLLEFSAKSIAHECAKWQLEDIVICGGGSHNRYFIERLESYLPGVALNKTDSIGIQADQVEAVAFAWLAHQTLNRLPSNPPMATGAKEHSILGGIFWSQ